MIRSTVDQANSFECTLLVSTAAQARTQQLLHTVLEPSHVQRRVSLLLQLSVNISLLKLLTKVHISI